jgi:hypothetical protein
MPIRHFIGNTSFSPDAINAMNAAFTDALKALGLVDRSDPLAEIVARKIVEIASTGELDPATLCTLAVDSLRH